MRVNDGAEIQLFVLDGRPCCIWKIEGAMTRTVSSQCSALCCQWSVALIREKSLKKAWRHLSYLRLYYSRSAWSTITSKTNGNKHNMEKEGVKGCVFTTAQRYNYSYLTDVRAASDKLKARWRIVWALNALLCAVNEVSLRFGKEVKK